MKSLSTNAEIQKYLKSIKKGLSGNSHEKEQILFYLERGILEYCDECPSATIEDIQEEFGTCSEIINIHKEDGLACEFCKQTSWKKACFTGLLVCTLIASSFITTYAIICHQLMATTIEIDMPDTCDDNVK